MTNHVVEHAWQLQGPLRYHVPVWVTGAPAIFGAMSAIKRGLIAVSKDRQNAQQGYKFRGIDDVFNAMHPLLAEQGVTTLPRVLTTETTERTTKNGSVQFHVRQEIEFTFLAPDGSALIVGPMAAEALDTSDKASNKCMSFAMKYMLLNTFTIPTDDVSEGDKETPEAGQRAEQPEATKAPSQSDIAAMVKAYADIGMDEHALENLVGGPLREIGADEFEGLRQNYKVAARAQKKSAPRTVNDIVKERAQ